jgi:ribonuclease HI
MAHTFVIENIIQVNNIIIRQINAHHRISAIALLDEESKEDKYFAHIIQEPHVNGQGKTPGFDNGIVHQNTPFARACIVTSRNLSIIPVTEFCDRDMDTIFLLKDGLQTFLCSVYMPMPSKKSDFVINPLLQSLVDYCYSKRVGLIIGADSNCHTPILGGILTADQPGAVLEHFLFSNNLAIHNQGSTPTFKGNGQTMLRESIIDFTATNEFVKYDIKSWRVDTNMNLSDHNTIRYELSLGNIIEEGRKNFKKCNRNRFQNMMNKGMEDLNKNFDMTSLANYDKFVYKFQSILTTSRDTCSPDMPKTKRKLKPFWNAELTSLKKIAESARKRMRRNRTQENICTSKKARNQYAHAITKARDKGWEEKCSKINSSAETSRLANILVSEKTAVIGLLRKNDNSYTENVDDTLELLMQTHYPNCEFHPGLDKEIPPKKKWKKGKFVVKFIKPKYIKSAIHSFGQDKTGGCDLINPRILRLLPDSALRVLNKIMRCAITNSYTPKAWRIMKAIYIPKPGKGVYDKPKCFRPITLSSYLLKTLEKLIQKVLTGNILQDPLENQHGFTTGKSCESALSRVTDIIEKAINNKLSCLGVFLDISGAFDNVKYSSVKRILRRRGLDKRITDWYDHLLKNRQIISELHGAICSKKPMQGTPQGGVLSAVIWNLVNQELLNIFKNGPIMATGLADDSNLLNSGTDEELLIAQMQKALDIVYEWGQREGLTFNATKTAVILFTLKTGINTNELTKLKMGGVELPYLRETKYLGITFNYRLSWTSHVTKKINECKGYLMALRQAIGKDWGLTPARIAWIWESIVRPKLIYGCLVWIPGLDIQLIHDKLNQLQRLALSMVSHSMKSTPLVTMEAVIGIPPIHLYIRQKALMARLRTRNVVTTDWDGFSHLQRQGHICWLDLELNEICPNNLIMDKTHKILKLKAHIHMAKKHDINENTVYIYTDGAKDINGTGAGYVIKIGETIVKTGTEHLGKATSVRQSELIAITLAATWCIKAKEIKDINTLIFFCDSERVLNQLDNQEKTSETTLECTKILNELSNQKHVSLHWVKSHNISTGNCHADFCAKLGKKTVPGAEPYAPVEMDYAKKIIKALYLINWQDDFDTKEILHTKKFITKVNTDEEMKKYVLNLKRNDLRQTISWISGHGTLKYHQNKIKQNDKKCRLCGNKQETPVHILKFCPETEYIRSIQHLKYQSTKSKDPAYSWKKRRLKRTFTMDTINKGVIDLILTTAEETADKLVEL